MFTVALTFAHTTILPPVLSFTIVYTVCNIENTFFQYAIEYFIRVTAVESCGARERRFSGTVVQRFWPVSELPVYGHVQ